MKTKTTATVFDDCFFFRSSSGWNSSRRRFSSRTSSWRKWLGIGSTCTTGRCASSSWTASSSRSWSCSAFASFASATSLSFSLPIRLWSKRSDSSFSSASSGDSCPTFSAMPSSIPYSTSFPFCGCWTLLSELPASFSDHDISGSLVGILIRCRC